MCDNVFCWLCPSFSFSAVNCCKMQSRVGAFICLRCQASINISPVQQVKVVKHYCILWKVQTHVKILESFITCYRVIIEHQQGVAKLCSSKKSNPSLNTIQQKVVSAKPVYVYSFLTAKCHCSASNPYLVTIIKYSELQPLLQNTKCINFYKIRRKVSKKNSVIFSINQEELG